MQNPPKYSIVITKTSAFLIKISYFKDGRWDDKEIWKWSASPGS